MLPRPGQPRHFCRLNSHWSTRTGTSLTPNGPDSGSLFGSWGTGWLWNTTNSQPSEPNAFGTVQNSFAVLSSFVTFGSSLNWSFSHNSFRFSARTDPSGPDHS